LTLDVYTPKLIKHPTRKAEIMAPQSSTHKNQPALDECACMNLRKTARLIAQFYDQRLQPGGLRNTQFTLLVVLDHLSPVSITSLADHMGMDRTTLTRNLRLLERDGFITGNRGKDARVRMISLTGKGRTAIKETHPLWQQAQKEFLQKFGKERWQDMRKNLTEISRILSSRS